MSLPDALTLTAGSTDTLVAVITDRSGNAIQGARPTFVSSNPNIVSVDSSGILNADSSGTTTVLATFDMLSASVEVTVTQSLATLLVEPIDTTLRVFGSTRLRLRGLDATGRELTVPAGTPTYATSDSAVLVVNDSGDVTAAGWGTAEIMVTLDGVSGSVTVSGAPGERATNGVQLATISIGAGHFCGLDAAGAAYCWGSSDRGETGYTSATPLPIQPVPTALRFVDLGAGQQMTCGRTTDQEVWCWGINVSGELGQGPGSLVTSSEVPLLVTGGHQWIAVGVGKHRGVCAFGQLGREPWLHSDPPVAPITGSFAATAVEVDIFTACAVSTDESPICWGLGTGLPAVIPGAPAMIQVSSGQLISCGLSAQSEAYCWGFATSQVLGRDLGGDGTASVQPPGPVIGGLQFTKLSVGSLRTCGITTSGQIHCWGDGIPWPGFPATPPKGMGGAEHTFIDIDSSQRSFCAVTTEGRVFCW
jgi:hypothetical protein